MLNNYNGDPNLDEHILANAKTSAGADGIVFGTSQTDEEYNDIISSALSAPENLPIWQAQDAADEHIVIDRLTEALTYINDKNPEGAGKLSWSALDPESLMALAAWTNQHLNIMPMIRTLTAGASAGHALSRDDLLNAIFAQRYFQGPTGYSKNAWNDRIGKTFSYVNAQLQTKSADEAPPPAANMQKSAASKPAAYHTASIWDLYDFDESLFTGAPRIGEAPDPVGLLVPSVAPWDDKINDIAEAMREAEHQEAARGEAGGSGTGWMTAGMRGLPDVSTIVYVIAAVVQQVRLANAAARQQPIPEREVHTPSGRPDDPVFISPDAISAVAMRAGTP